MADRSSILVDQVKSALNDDAQLNIEGGGSKAFLGRATKGRLISMKEHSGVVSYDPGELIITVRAGTPLGEIESALAKNGQVLTFEPPHFTEHATIGGTIATNLSGPARPWAGSGRDMLLGMRLIDGRGELLTFGGQVMKNVAGYDVSRMQCGGFGCFGLITDLSLKVLPGKSRATSMVAAIQDADAAIGLMNRFSAQNIPLTGAAWCDGKLHVRLESGQSSLSSAVDTLKAAASDIMFSEGDLAFWTQLRDQNDPFFKTDDPIWRFSIKSTASSFLPDQRWILDWAGGQRWLAGDFDRRELEREAVAAGGTVSCFRNADQSAEAFQAPDPVTRRLLGNLKTKFDPKGIFNPGRLYSWL